MPQEKKSYNQPNKFWKLYVLARKWQREGSDYQTVNKRLRDATNGDVKGIAWLEKELGVHDNDTRLDKLGGSALSVLEGVGMGWTGEAVGRIAQAIPGGEDYDTAREMYESKLRGFREDHPVANVVGEAAGGVLGTLPLIGAGGMALGGKGGLLAQSAGGAVTSGIMGAPFGAVYSAGQAEPGQRYVITRCRDGKRHHKRCDVVVIDRPAAVHITQQESVGRIHHV